MKSRRLISPPYRRLRPEPSYAPIALILSDYGPAVRETSQLLSLSASAAHDYRRSWRCLKWVNRVGSATRQAGTQYLKKRTRWPAAGASAAEPFATGRRSRRRVCFLVRRNGDGAELVESLGVSVGTASRAVRRDGK
jgi:hypothetical protein